MEELSKSVLDTLYHVTVDGGTYCVLGSKESWFSYSVSIGDILTIIGFLVTLFVFYKQLKESREEGKSNLKSKWFLEVIVQPNLTSINKLYVDIVAYADKSRNELHQRYDSSESAKELTLELARMQRDAKDSIKDFFDHFRALLMASEPSIPGETDSIVDELVDIVTTHMDDYESSDNESCKRKVLANKEKLIKVLYKGLSR